MNKNQFKLIKLALRQNPIFSGIDIDFRDEEDKSNSPYISLIIGPNGTGKSNLLRIIIDLFRQIYDHQNGKYQTHVYGEFYIKYSVGKDIYEYSNTLPFDEVIEAQGKKRRNIFVIKNGDVVNYSDLALPSALLASSIMVTDKFYYEKDNKYPFYNYLGVRTSSNQSGTLSYIRKSIDLLIKGIVKDSNSFLNKFKRIFEVLEFDNRLTIRYRVSYKDMFFDGQMSEEKLIDIFSNWKSYFPKRTTAPYGQNRLLILHKKNPEKIKNIVAVLNKLKNEEFLRSNEQGNSKTEFITYELMNNEISREDYDGIIELNKLDILRSPSITFYKNKIPIGYKESSSGEQHIITTLIGIFSKIEHGSLILLDEPEISLHPNWQMRYINDFIIELFKEYSTCQFIIATHSHFLASDIRGNSSKIIGLRKVDNKIENINFGNIDTFGWSAEEVLYEIFKVKSTRNSYVESDLIQLLDIINRDSKDMKILNEILDRLNSLNLSKNDPTNIIIEKGFKYLKSNA